MRVGRVVAALEHDGIVGREARQRVDMGIGVIAFQIAVLQPQHALLAQGLGQYAGHVLACVVAMALGQATPSAQQSAAAIGFDRATFKREVDALHGLGAQDATRRQARHQRIVAAGFEFAAPAGETEVEET